MAGKLTKHAFEQLIKEDIEWLKKQRRTLERDHVIGIVEDCVDHYYPEEKPDVGTNRPGDGDGSQGSP